MIRLCSDKVKLYIRRPQNPQIPGMRHLIFVLFSCLSGLVIDLFVADDYCASIMSTLIQNYLSPNPCEQVFYIQLRITIKFTSYILYKITILYSCTVLLERYSKERKTITTPRPIEHRDYNYCLFQITCHDSVIETIQVFRTGRTQLSTMRLRFAKS